MMARLTLVLVVAALAACSEPVSVESDVVTYRIDPARVTVSGISSGAYMAGQLHVAHSALFRGAGLLAGGPWYCAEGSIRQGVGPCVDGGEIDTARLAIHARKMAAAGKIDRLENLADDAVWVFIGALDDRVDADVARAAADFYRELHEQADVTLVTDIAVVHGMPTLGNGLACDAFGSPFIQNCDYDAAGILLEALYGKLEPRSAAGGELLNVAQPGGAEAEMLDKALLYVPASCAAGETCGVHVALHGCMQSSEYVQGTFATGAGYNEWAETNRLLVLYPQVASSKIAPMNPYGCWDWWGYTDTDYATHDGRQVGVIKATLDSLAGTIL